MSYQANNKEVKKQYIKAILTNDENSTDLELVKLFMKELHINGKQASVIVANRNYYLNKI